VTTLLTTKKFSIQGFRIILLLNSRSSGLQVGMCTLNRQRFNFKSNSYFKGSIGCAREFLVATASMNLYTGQGRHFMGMGGKGQGKFLNLITNH
jgi:hypothetical protein